MPLPPLQGWQVKGRPPPGSQGQVFYCADGAHERAVKIIDLGLKSAADALTARENFEREHKALRGLRHDHVVPLIDGGELGELLYLVTDCLPGTLRGALDLNPHRPLPMARAIHIAVQLADALAYIHDQEVVHRDVKPANIGLTHDDQVMLFDFGLAGFRRTGVALSSMAGAFGTPGYAAPEQLPPPGVNLDEARPLTGTWTDCFSFGVVLHELLSGSPPRYLGPSSKWPPPLPTDPTRPPQIDTLIAACLEPDIDRRLRDAWRLQDELGDVADRLTVKHRQAQEAWQQIGHELPGLRKERERLKNEVRALEARHTALDAELATEAEMRRQQATAAVGAEVARLEKQRVSLTTEITRLDQQRAALEVDTNRLAATNADTRRAAGTAENELVALRAEVAAAEAALPRPGFKGWPVVGLLVGLAVGYLVGHAGQPTPEPTDASAPWDASVRPDANLIPPSPDAAQPPRDTLAVAAPATAAARKPGGDEVDDLLGGLERKPGAGRPAGGGDFDPALPDYPLLPERLTRQQILLVVKQGAGRVNSCKAQDPNASGTVKVAMVIEPRGNVSSATVTGGPLKGGPAGNCVEEEVKSLKFPQFRGEPMRVNMPFAL